MKITNHARLRMQQRGIEESSVASAIMDPDEIDDSFGKRKLVRKAIGENTLEVVYIEEDEIVVITVYWSEET